MSFFSGFPFGDFFEGGGRSRAKEEANTTKYYELLGVDKSASCADIRKKYRVLAKTMHPDKGGDPKVFAEITHAAEILSDPDKRKVYDAHGEEGINQGMSASSGPTDIFDILSGRGRDPEQSKRTPDTSFTLKVSLEDLYNGTTKKIAINRDRVCTDCGGQGGSKSSTCSQCKGKGMVTRMTQMGPGMFSQSTGPCDVCRGQGKWIDDAFKCKTCKGNQVIKERKVVEITVDKGAPNHHKYNFHGESDEAPGQLPGDLIVIIEEKEHEIFKRKKADLIMTKKISLKEALTGYCFSINHFEGEKVIQSSPGDIIKPGDIRTVEELGMPLMRTPYQHGNLFIYFEVEFPAPGSLSPSDKNTLKKILPGNDAEVKGKEGKVHKCIVFDKSHVTENNTKIHSDYKDEEEDEDPRMKGGQKVQCSGTIF
jgi:DnaJ homolog subfamily A member 2